ncbi:ABC transporter permease [Candidatus Falkowbacteria bacterium]|nr:ABC transporter permease [Candidatus Falkowbacteria bacterium]
MILANALPIATGALHRNKGRTVLTILGVVIGIAAVVVVMSAGNALEAFVLGQLEAFGSDYIEIEPKVPNVSKTSTANAHGLTQGVAMTSLKNDDLEAVQQMRNIKMVYGAVTGQAIVRYANDKKTAMLWGTTEDYPRIDTGEVAEGRFFTDEESRSLARVAVLGYDVKQRFFGEADALGQNIKVGKYNFKVIGVYSQKGSAFFFNMDDIIYLPLETTQKLIMGIDHVSFMVAKLQDPSREQESADEATRLLRDRHNLESDNPDKDDFAVNTPSEAKDILGTVIGGIQLLLIAIAAISLLVGGVGIMNIMYVSVTERTSEIGLRKAVGATSRDVLWQFLLEAVVITFVGGIVGVVLGIAVSAGVSVGASHFGFDFAFIISWAGVVLACIFSIGTGLLFGLYPARKAARLDPIEALRYE